MTPLAQDILATCETPDRPAWRPASECPMATVGSVLGWYRELGEMRIVQPAGGLWFECNRQCVAPDLWRPLPPAPEVGGYGHGVAPKSGWPTPGYDRYAAAPDQTNDSKGGYQ